MYDIIVIGARCAGAPAAMLLGRRGYRVLLVDRATFPSDIPHGHFIHRDGPRRLARWGLLDRVAATGCPSVETMTFDAGDFPLTGRGLTSDGVAAGYGPRRSALDRVLVEAAAEAGVEVRPGFAVESFLTDGDRLEGVTGRDVHGGATVAERARVTVGADGRNSRLARAVQAPVYEVTPAVTFWYFSYWSGVAGAALEIYVRDRRVIFAFPTNDSLFAIFVAWPTDEFPAVRAGIEAAFLDAVARVPELAGRVREGRREERFFGATDLPNFLRKPFGPGWALVGDAGCHKDPYSALGICDAFRDAEYLADALDAGLSGREPLEATLADFERRRNEATMADYRENLHLAQFRPLPQDAYRLRAALWENQDATNRFFLAREGLIPLESFFNPENLGRLMGATPVQGR